jgi:hypothetical protein
VSRGSWPLLLPGVLLLLAVAPPEARTSQETMDRVRHLYLAAVHDERAIDRGLRAIAELRAGAASGPGSASDGVLSAYEGALVTLRAKHGLWPPARLRHLRDGLGMMDRAVAAHPHDPEIRYLRLMSCYYLPGMLGRTDSVREDFAALARLLPAARDDYPPDLYGSIVRFVLENGGIAQRDRGPLEMAIGAAGDD